MEPYYTNTKPWWLSRTIWVNLLAFAGMFLIGHYVDSKTWAEISVGALAIINLALRLCTGSGIEGTPGAEL